MTFSDRKTTGKRDKDIDDVRTRCFMRRGNARLFDESVSPLDSSAKEIAERLGDGTRESGRKKRGRKACVGNGVECNGDEVKGKEKKGKKERGTDGRE